MAKRKRTRAPSKYGPEALKTKAKGLRKVKDATTAKTAKQAFQLAWRTAWIDQRGRRVKAPEGEPPAGWRQVAWQAYRDTKGRWVKPSREALDAIETQYEIRYRLTKGLPGKRNEWRTEEDITRDDPYLWMRKLDVARFSRKGDKGRWTMLGILDKNQDLRNLAALDKYRRLRWSEVPQEQKIEVRLQGRTLAEALGRFVFPVAYGETWSISGMVNVSYRNDAGQPEEASLTFSTVEDWYKRYLRDKDGNILRDPETGKPRFDPNSGVYGQDLHASWRNRVRDEVSKRLADIGVRFSNAESVRKLWEDGSLARRKKAGYWTYQKAKRDKNGKAIPGTAGRKWVASTEITDHKAGDRLYHELMSRKQATDCSIILWVERVKIPD